MHRILIFNKKKYPFTHSCINMTFTDDAARPGIELTSPPNGYQKQWRLYGPRRYGAKIRKLQYIPTLT